MAADFAYNGSKIVQCNGTSGTPKTFADMHDADMAGSLTVLDAGVIDNDPNTFSLGTALQPADSRQMKLTISTSADRAGATITITGTDLDGDAIVENNIDIATAFTTPVETTLKFAGVDASGISVAGMTNDDTVTITQPRWGVIWEIVEDGQYKIDCDVDFGNGSDSTYFASEKEMVYFADDKDVTVKTYAILRLGYLEDTWVSWGSMWSIGPDALHAILPDGDAGTFLLYGSHLHLRTDNIIRFYGAVTAKSSIFSGISNIDGAGYQWNCKPEFYTGPLSFDTVLFSGLAALALSVVPTLFNNVRCHSCNIGMSTVVNVVALGLDITDYTYKQFQAAEPGTITLTNPKFTPIAADIVIDVAAGWAIERYTCNIHVTDKDGADLDAVDVDCEYTHLVEGSDSKTYKCIQDHTSVDATHKPITGSDWASFWELYDAGGGLGGPWQTTFDFKAGTEEFAQDTTDADGDITEQTIDYKKWVGTSELLEARMHKFTFSHADYPDFVMSDIIVDHPLVWEIDMGQNTSDLQTIVAGELATYDPPTRAELTTDKNAIITHLLDVKGTGFAKDTHSLPQCLTSAETDVSNAVHTYTVLDGDGNGIADVLVEAKINDVLIQSARTNTSGIATFYLAPGTYDFYATKSGFQFSNPDQEVVSA